VYCFVEPTEWPFLPLPPAIASDCVLNKKLLAPSSFHGIFD
jgi:hypothetical protein